MNQILSFKPFLIQKVLNGSKDLTTRIATDFRKKLNIGDTAYIATGIRTKNYKRHAEAIVIDRSIWNQKRIQYINSLEENEKGERNDYAPIVYHWITFANREGFNTTKEMIAWFSQKQYIDKELVTYQFTLKDTLDNWME